MEAVLQISGLHCASCEALIKDVAKDWKEITRCDVDVISGKVTLEHQNRFNLTPFVSAIDDLGPYKVTRIDPTL